MTHSHQTRNSAANSCWVGQIYLDYNKSTDIKPRQPQRWQPASTIRASRYKAVEGFANESALVYYECFAVHRPYVFQETMRAHDMMMGPVANAFQMTNLGQNVSGSRQGLGMVQRTMTGSAWHLVTCIVLSSTTASGIRAVRSQDSSASQHTWRTHPPSSGSLRVKHDMAY